MKNITKLSLLGLTFLTFLGSCEKNDTLTKKEGLKNKEGDKQIELDGAQEASVLFQKSYTGLSDEEANTKWFQDVRNSGLLNKKGSTKKCIFYITTQTGWHENSETDGAVKCRLNYNLNGGTSAVYAFFDLNNPDVNDRQRGAKDYYLIEGPNPANTEIESLKLTYLEIGLQGTDGWFLNYIRVGAFDYQQEVPAQGSSTIYMPANSWLDNHTEEGWSMFTATVSGTAMKF